MLIGESVGKSIRHKKIYKVKKDTKKIYSNIHPTEE